MTVVLESPATELSVAGEPGNAECRSPRRAATWVVIAAYNEGTSVRPCRDSRHGAARVASGHWPAETVTARAVIHDHHPPAERDQFCHDCTALQTGIDYALSAGADAIVTFDADGQHKAADVASLADALDGADVALGARFLRPVAMVNWLMATRTKVQSLETRKKPS